MQRSNIISAAVASVAVGLAASATHGQYLIDTTFQAVTPTTVGGTTYGWTEPTNWTNGVPTGTALALINTQPAQQIAGPVTAYGVRYESSGGTNTTVGTATGAVLTLLSKDSAYDAVAKTAPAIESINVAAQSEFKISAPIVLGDATTTSGTAYFVNSNRNNGLIIGNNVSEAAGQSWGVTFGGAGNFESALRGDSNSGNYLRNRMTITGQVTIAAGANLRLYSNLLNSGAGLPNLVVDGRFSRSNNGAIITNAVDGSGQLTLSSGNNLVVGANNGNGSFSGILNNGSLRFYKVGSGTQSLGGGTNVNAVNTIWVTEGGVVADAVNRLGGASAVTTLDGGSLIYTGAGETAAGRTLNVSFRGGSIESSGTGALVFDAATVFTGGNIAHAFGDAELSAANQVVSNGLGLKGLSNPAFAGKLVISADVQTTIAAGSTGFTVDESARTIDLGAGNTVNVSASNTGAPRFTFTQNAAIDRTLTLGGSNTGANTIAAVLADSANGKLAITKTGAGTWQLTGANTYTGATTVNGGTLAVPKITLATPTAYTTNAGGTLKLLAVDTTTDTTGRSAANATTLVNNGRLDVGETGIVLSDADAAVVRAQIVSGRGGAGGTATWAGATGITSSRAALTPANRAVGYTVSGTTVTVAQTVAGDANLDGRVNAFDRSAYLGNVGQSGRNWQQADFNYDGNTNAFDRAVYLANVGTSIDPAPPALTLDNTVANDSIPNVTYDPTTGKVTLATDGLNTINAFILHAAQADVLSAVADPDGASGVAWSTYYLGGQNWESSVFSSAGDLTPGTWEIATLKAGLGAGSFTAGGTGIDFILSNGNIVNTSVTVAAIPEPTTLAALAGLGVAGFGRRRRRAVAR